MSFAVAILLLGLLIFFHELGHFLVAKACKVGVEVFSIGFGRKLLSFRHGETEYRLSMIPLGGYVKMMGESLEGADEQAAVPHEKSFAHKSVWQRMAIVAAGPLFNFLLAIVLLSLVHINGVPRLEPIIGTVQPDSAAYAAGLQPGDRIITINDMEIHFWDDITRQIHLLPGVEVRVVVERNDQLASFQITPRQRTVQNIFGEDREVGFIGITASEQTVNVRYGPLQSLGMGVVRTWELTSLTFQSIVKLIQRIIPADNIGGPIMIVQVASEQVSHGFNSVLFFAALISVNLAILNLLPIPILDGGHLMFYIYEAIRGKAPSLKAREIAARIGMALLLCLMFFAFYNDIRRIIVGG
ncbi:RIP metalloprotease RseP [Desulfurispirillum indicum]|uniref:Zinc metalloprotease n=1 Tax=Desulfurispirillum indicum (strain ATCC BAA-1389 / DSM 22839 / S5) TaxID=653733 RepID=E6W173_DESIS|nr:RIP metalloprotease RseP [Desulfurispirillum indicum]ADU66493.1 membrane-associated zinc metalloprotease [Desulfurispirillum indicum S5]UCZ55829.1 RIP metalloprotease RseP [Desulfurispirillum indicum]